MSQHNTAKADDASQTNQTTPRLLAAVKLANKHAVSLPYAKIIAELQGYGRAAYE